MGEVVNLRIWRKRQTKDQEAMLAAQNRQAHGRSKQDRADHVQQKAKETRHLDQHKLEPDEPA